MTTFEMRVPQGAQPGSTFPAAIGTTVVNVIVPVDARPGDAVRITMDAAPLHASMGPPQATEIASAGAGYHGTTGAGEDTPTVEARHISLGEERAQTIRRRLAEARRAGLRRRMIISGPMFTVGGLFLLGGIVALVFTFIAAERDPAYVSVLHISFMLIGASPPVALLGLLPTDESALQVVALAIVTVAGLISIQFLSSLFSSSDLQRQPICGAAHFDHFISLPSSAPLVLACLHAIVRLGSAVVLRQEWCLRRLLCARFADYVGVFITLMLFIVLAWHATTYVFVSETAQLVAAYAAVALALAMPCACICCSVATVRSWARRRSRRHHQGQGKQEIRDDAAACDSAQACVCITREAAAEDVRNAIGTRDLLRRIWAALGWVYAAATAGYVILASGNLATRFASAWHVVALLSCIEHATLAYICFRPDLRTRIQKMLEARGEGLTSAAGVASLISGDRDVEVTMAAATARMRGITLNLITFEEFVRRDGAVGLLYVRSFPVKPGELDAFVSWHDPPAPKWAELQRWRAEFVAKHNREPRIWLDKCCINQADIDSDLANLPVYLAGCSTLLVMAGHTYLQRLWCVVELFVFVTMGGQDMNLRLLPGLDRGAFRTFDAAKCSCFKQDDYNKMLAFIEAVSLSVSDFNSKVVALLDGAHATAPGREALAAAAEDPEPGAATDASPRPKAGQSRASEGGWELTSRTVDAARRLLSVRDVSPGNIAWAGFVVSFVAFFVWLVAWGGEPSARRCAECAQFIEQLPRDEEGWVVNDGRAYHFTGMGAGAEPLTFDGAREYCATRGGHVVSILSAAENDFLACLLGKAVSSHLGLFRAGRGEPWTWDDPDMPSADAVGSYNNWDSYEPQDGPPGAERHCVVFLYDRWQTNDCDRLQLFACERPA